MRKPIMAGNWKMHKTLEESREFVQSIIPSIAGTDVEVMLFVPYTLLAAVKQAAAGSALIVGAQNVHFEDQGAYTGEISPLMLEDLGITHTLIGHSERREYFGETDETVNRKVHAILRHGLQAIVCVGESLETRESGQALPHVKMQVEAAFEGVQVSDMEQLTIAYEPIWAIGTGKTATSAQAGEMIAYIRSLLAEKYGEECSEEIRILYGGSVKPENVEDLMQQDDIDGGLVGGASLKPDVFVELVNF